MHRSSDNNKYRQHPYRGRKHFGNQNSTITYRFDQSDYKREKQDVQKSSNHSGGDHHNHKSYGLQNSNYNDSKEIMNRDFQDSVQSWNNNMFNDKKHAVKVGINQDDIESDVRSSNKIFNVKTVPQNDINPFFIRKEVSNKLCQKPPSGETAFEHHYSSNIYGKLYDAFKKINSHEVNQVVMDNFKELVKCSTHDFTVLYKKNEKNKKKFATCETKIMATEAKLTALEDEITKLQYEKTIWESEKKKLGDTIVQLLVKAKENETPIRRDNTPQPPSNAMNPSSPVDQVTQENETTTNDAPLNLPKWLVPKEQCQKYFEDSQQQLNTFLLNFLPPLYNDAEIIGSTSNTEKSNESEAVITHFWGSSLTLDICKKQIKDVMKEEKNKRTRKIYKALKTCDGMIWSNGHPIECRWDAGKIKFVPKSGSSKDLMGCEWSIPEHLFKSNFIEDVDYLIVVKNDNIIRKIDLCTKRSTILKTKRSYKRQ